MPMGSRKSWAFTFSEEPFMNSIKPYYVPSPRGNPMITRWRLQFKPLLPRWHEYDCHRPTAISGKTFTSHRDNHCFAWRLRVPFLSLKSRTITSSGALSPVNPSGATIIDIEQNSVITSVSTTSSGVTVKYVWDKSGGKGICVSKRNGRWSWFLGDSEVSGQKIDVDT